MPVLAVSGASLQYTSHPPATSTNHSSKSVQPKPPRYFLLIPGAPGTSSVFDILAPTLAARGFTVITYTRRGYAGSPLTAANAGEGGLETDADDAAALLELVFSQASHGHENLASEQPTQSTETNINIFATSSGGIVALSLLQRHPHLARRCKRILIHEPPLVSVFPTTRREAMRSRFTGLYDLYQAQGPEAAVRKWIGLFADKWEREVGIIQLMNLDGRRVGDKGNLQVPDENQKPGSSTKNLIRWLEHEIRQFTSTPSITLTTLSAVPADAREKARLIAGELSYNASAQALTLGAIAAPIVAGLWDQEVIRVPGGHIGYANEEFVGWFAATLEDLTTKDNDQQFW